MKDKRMYEKTREKNKQKSIGSAIRTLSIVAMIIMVAMTWTVSAKSLYVNKDLNSGSPISAYDIQPAPTYLVPQMTSSPTRYGGAGLGIDTDSKTLFVTFEGSGVFDIVDATTLGLLGQVTAPGASNLAGIVVDQEKQKVYTNNRGASFIYIYSWDATNKKLTLDNTQALSGAGQIYGIALDETKDLLYIGDLTKSVKVYDTNTWALVKSLPISQNAMGIAVDTKNGFVYTGNAYPSSGSLGRLSKYDLNLNTESAINVRELSGGITSDNVVGLAVDQATSLLYITTGNQGSGGSDRIIVFDSNLNMLYATGDIGDPTGIVVPGKEISYNPLNLQKSDGLSACANPGDTVTYTLSYNNGNAYDVTGAKITDTLPSEVEFVSASNGGTLSGNVVTWDIGTITQGSSGQVTLTVKIKSGTPGGTTITDSATIDSDQTPPTTQSETTDTCTNQPPVAEAGGPYTVNEGSSVTVDGSGSSDPDGDTLTYAWDLDNDGTYETPGVTAVVTPQDGPATLTVGLQVSDGKGGVSTDTATINVNNVAPTVDAGSDQTINEGDTASFSGSFTDPGTVDTHTIEWDFGDGPTTSGTLTPSHVYADNGIYTVKLKVTDKDGGIGEDSLQITVNNVAPTIDSLSADKYLAPVNTAITGTGAFHDPGTLDTFTADWNWEDSTNTQSLPAGSTSTTDSHTYATPGVYSVSLKVTDKDGGSDTENMPQYVVIYDPSAGFVTGGGWIDSPAGAYPADPTLTGKANFGFVSKYQKGATKPTGQTEFQFHAGNLNFHSISYDWLVVAGAKAQYKGNGTVNGAGNYGFLLTATDGQINGGGGVDKFRIKIVDKSTGNVVYDNVLGASEDIDVANPQAIAGGSIVIHK